MVWNDTHQNEDTPRQLQRNTPSGDFLIWNGAYDSYSKMSRDQWHEALLKWKTQVVISGHMHETAWIPGNDTFPYAQMVGGGPQAARATWMEIKADQKELSLLVKTLDGQVAEKATFPQVR